MPERKYKYPEKVFFTQNPRSNEIRNAVVDVVKSVEILQGSNLETLSVETQVSQFLVLETAHKKLTELGISGNMHVGEPDDFFKNDPERIAEWLAGQAIGVFTKTHIVSMQEAYESTHKNVITKFTAGLMGDGKKKVPDSVLEYTTQKLTLVHIMSHFCITKEDFGTN